MQGEIRMRAQDEIRVVILLPNTAFAGLRENNTPRHQGPAGEILITITAHFRAVIRKCLFSDWASASAMLVKLQADLGSHGNNQRSISVFVFGFFAACQVLPSRS